MRKKHENDLGVKLFLSPTAPGGDSGYVIPTQSLTVGPGDPGPGDEWHFPTDDGPEKDATPSAPPAASTTAGPAAPRS